MTTQLAAERQYVPSDAVTATPGGTRPASGSDLDSRIRDSESRLEELLLVYTPKHPEVIALQESLAQLRAKRREELTAMGVTGIPEGGSLAANPVYEQIRVQRNQVDVDLAALRGQIADRTRRIAEMQRRVETMPEVEAELAQLTRDYDVLRARYGELLQQFETAKLSDAVGQKDQVEFSVLDPPAALAQPVSPPRLLLLIGVLVLGLGAGGGNRLRNVEAESRVRLVDDIAGRNGSAGARCRQRHVARSSPGPQARGDAADCGRQRGIAGRFRRRGACPRRGQPLPDQSCRLSHESHRTGRGTAPACRRPAACRARGGADPAADRSTGPAP